MAIFNNTQFYRDSILKHGISPKGVHWRSKTTQEKRFEILLDFIKDEINTSSIIDAGCGFGDLIKYFSSKNLYPKNYLGIDKEDFFVQIASTLYPNTNFKQIDILKNSLIEADYYICSGAMNILDLNEMRTFIKKCFIYSNKGFIFNFLVNTTFNEVTKEDILEFCESLNAKIFTKENYLDNDFSIFIKKI